MGGRVRAVGVLGMCLVLIGLAPGVLAQVAGETPSAAPELGSNTVALDLPPNVPEWGITAPIAYNVPGWSFTNLHDSQHGRSGAYIYKSGGTNGFFDQTAHLPSGAAVFGVTMFYYDADAADVSFWLYRETGTSSTGFTFTSVFSDHSNGATGFQGGYHALAAPETIRNVDPANGQTNMYLLTVSVSPSGLATDLRFGGATLWYTLQISPAPATATFSDVPTGYWAFRQIEALAASGITAGCGGSNFCPENYVKRSEMAVYLAKALGLHWADGSIT